MKHHDMTEIDEWYRANSTIDPDAYDPLLEELAKVDDLEQAIRRGLAAQFGYGKRLVAAHKNGVTAVDPEWFDLDSMPGAMGRLP